jgi:hypothetical protein
MYGICRRVYLQAVSNSQQKQTTKTYHRPDPSFTYLLSFLLTLTSLAWGFAYAKGFTQTLHITLVFNLNEADGGKEELEFGYCWDVAIRAFVPVWLFLYVVQFLCMPLVGTDHW